MVKGRRISKLRWRSIIKESDVPEKAGIIVHEPPANWLFLALCRIIARFFEAHPHYE
jgi:hypothetical protein